MRCIFIGLQQRWCCKWHPSTGCKLFAAHCRTGFRHAAVRQTHSNGQAAGDLLSCASCSLTFAGSDFRLYWWVKYRVQVTNSQHGFNYRCTNCYPLPILIKIFIPVAFPPLCAERIVSASAAHILFASLFSALQPSLNQQYKLIFFVVAMPPHAYSVYNRI